MADLEQRIADYKHFHYCVLKLWMENYLKDAEYFKVMDRLNTEYQKDIIAYDKKYV